MFIPVSIKFYMQHRVNLQYVPLSDIIGVAKIDSRINPHYYHSRNMPCIWILIGVPVYCGAWKVSKQHRPWSCYLKKYLGKRD
jgi:hypothetical protein